MKRHAESGPEDERSFDGRTHGKTSLSTALRRLLMQCLRTTRQHLALAIGAMRDAAALSDDEDWEKQTGCSAWANREFR
jgi:hypothetical protein